MMFSTLENTQQNRVFLILIFDAEVKEINIVKILRINYD